ncbi:MAG: phosphatase PAP2 family protein [Firmicutes bacterium]|jgi:diacylglycerol kinase (ATP)|nr:phosphatase PAP2 family protein [Bacillota bacterium]
MRSRDIFASFNYAIQGVIYTLRTQRNMKIHFGTGALVLILAVALRVSRSELIALFLTVGMVITAELLNTAVEEVVNLVTNEYHPIAATAKNVAAGAVLVSAVISVFVGYLVFVDKLAALDASLLRSSIPPRYLVPMAVAAVAATIIAIKAAHGHDDYLRGGMPSGHAAIAFALATAIWFTGSGVTTVLGFAIALLVAHGRVDCRIHTFWEVLAGALVGILVTAFFFQLHLR